MKGPNSEFTLANKGGRNTHPSHRLHTYVSNQDNNDLSKFFWTVFSPTSDCYIVQRRLEPTERGKCDSLLCGVAVLVQLAPVSCTRSHCASLPGQSDIHRGKVPSVSPVDTKLSR
eukprot:2906077-Amphidinium_carterae.1